jgi:hypothetical protein
MARKAFGISNADAFIPFFGRTISGGVAVVASDLLVHRYRVPFPKGYESGWQVELDSVAVTAKVAPALSDFIADQLVSSDDGATWTSLYPSGLANKADLPAGQEKIVLTPAWATPYLFYGDQLRFDVLQVDGVASGLELLLTGKYIPI